MVYLFHIEFCWVPWFFELLQIHPLLAFECPLKSGDSTLCYSNTFICCPSTYRQPKLHRKLYQSLNLVQFRARPTLILASWTHCHQLLECMNHCNHTLLNFFLQMTRLWWNFSLLGLNWFTFVLDFIDHFDFVLILQPHSLVLTIHRFLVNRRVIKHSTMVRLTQDQLIDVNFAHLNCQV